MLLFAENMVASRGRAMYVPASTYRLQMNRLLGFNDVRRLLPYLEDLGIGAIYASPIFKARPWSLHGYDIVDFNHLNPEIGTAEEFDRLAAEVRRRNMGWVQDTVPNHMAYHHDNALLMDVLRRGMNSAYSRFFDIEWTHPLQRLCGRILAPFLQRPYSECLAGGDFEKVLRGKEFWIRYKDRLFPLDPDGPSSGPVGDLLAAQNYVLAYWKYGAWRINYRRFFDISGLICLQAESGDVFEHTHALVLNLVKAGKVTGLRIDHVDGLRSPAEYLSRLRLYAPDAYIIVEKILTRGETLRPWDVQGTTGYDFLNAVNGILCMRDSREEFDAIYAGFTNLSKPYDELRREKKRLVMAVNLRGETDNLARWLVNTMQTEHGKELPDLLVLREALVETLANLPVYRTYSGPDEFLEIDRVVLGDAISRAGERRPELLAGLAVLRKCLLEVPLGDAEPVAKLACSGYLETLQQYMGAVMAKGFEDTLLYVYNRLLSLNEVGGYPDRFGSPVEEFHGFNLERADATPHTLNTTSTHDTKRGEDTRARINVLSEIPNEWRLRSERWSEINEDKRKLVSGRKIPDRNDEYFLYQTLVGAYPFAEAELDEFGERVARYLRKVTREAKVHMTHREPDPVYEEGFVDFATRILDRAAPNPFLDDFLPFQRRIAHYGAINSLSQTLLKICSPGVPDFYQGSELWDLTLVDPDNRRPVDFELRRRMLEDMLQVDTDAMAGMIAEMLSDVTDGRVKLFLIQRALAARKNNAYLFERAGYIGLRASGEFSRHVVAFARVHAKSYAICIAPRLAVGLVDEGTFPMDRGVWGDTHVIIPEDAPRAWKDAISGQRVVCTGKLMIGDALATFPVSMLLEDTE